MSSLFPICKQTSRLNDINAELELTWSYGLQISQAGFRAGQKKHCKMAPECMDHKLSWRQSANSQTTRAFPRRPSGLPKIHQKEQPEILQWSSIWTAIDLEQWKLILEISEALLERCWWIPCELRNKQTSEGKLTLGGAGMVMRETNPLWKFCACVENPVICWQELVRARPTHR